MAERLSSISFVLLAYNEEASIAEAISECRAVGRAHAAEWEIVVVDDGSRDRTVAAAREVDEGDLQLVIHDRNRGMGASMRDGYRAARMDYLAHLPGDRQVRAEAIAAMVPLCGPETIALSSFINPPSGPGRAAMSVFFRLLTRYGGGLRVNFAGTYLFHRDWLSRIDSELCASDTFLYSFQLLEEWRREGARFAEVAVPTYPRLEGQSREATLRRIAFMVGEIGRTRARRWRHLRG